MDPTQAGLVDLPDDILQICFARLPLKDVPRLNAICRKWRQLARPQSLQQLRRKHGLMQTYTIALDNGYFGGLHQGLKGIAIDVKSRDKHPIATLGGPPRLQFGAAGVSGHIYVLGGRSPLICRQSTKAWEVYSRVDVYEPLSNSWHQRQAMLVARYGFAAGVVDDIETDTMKIIVAGGYDSEGEALSSVEAYDFRKDEWEVIASMSIVCGPCRGEVLEGKFVVQQANGGLDAIETYDLKSCQWAAFNSKIPEFCLKLSPEKNITVKSIKIDV